MGLEGELQADFRRAMRRVAGTVSVVSVRCGGERHGSTATSITSVSMSPPSLLVCFSRESRLHGFLLREKRFCVNVLHTDNCAVSQVFASAVPASERFASGEWRDAGGIPYLVGAQANLFCDKDREIDYATHTIFVGRVTSVLARPEVAPLLYRDGAYATAVDLDGAAPSR